VGHLPGKGKYQGMLGALLVETEQGKRFRIGTGFSDAERRHPPPIGSILTYQYHGLTPKGLPRFSSFLRIREEY
jgi:DNA ligase-1